MIWVARTEVEVVSTTEVLTVVAVTTSVSDTTSVSTLVAVRVTVEAGTVLPTFTVTVSAPNKQLHALESLEAGWWTRFVLTRVGQLTVAEVDRVRFFIFGTTVKSLVEVVVAVVTVTVVSAYSVLVSTERISVVVVL